MALKDILVHLENSPGCEARLDLAISIAKSHGAHLTGLYVISHQYYVTREGSDQFDAEKAKSLFEKKTQGTGISSKWLTVDWEVVGVGITEILTLHAYHVDLIIVGQPNLSDPNRKVMPELPDRLTLGAGRPVMVVPYVSPFTETGQRIMVAWKAGREATRALNDALPLLEKADFVTLVEVSHEGGKSSVEERIDLDICTHLSRHNITAIREKLSAPAGFPIGDILLNHACDQNIDLLVMGSHSQNRRGTFVVGPVTKHLLNHLTVPLLISH